MWTVASRLPIDCKTRFRLRFPALRLQHSVGEQTFRHFMLLSLISLLFSSLLFSSLLFSSLLFYLLPFPSLLICSRLFSSFLFSSLLSFSHLFSSLPFCSVPFSSRKKICNGAKTDGKYKISIISSPICTPDFFNPFSILYSSVSAPWNFKYVHQTCKFWSS